MALDLSHSKLENVNFSEAELSGSNFNYSRMEGVIFDSIGGSDGIKFHHADLKNASFKQANLAGSKVEFMNADLSYADFTGARITTGNFSNAKLNGTILKGVNLSRAKNLTQAQINHAIGDSTTKLPSGLHAPASWQ